MSETQCQACEEQAIRRIKLRYSNTNIVLYDICLKHSLMAQNDLFKFLKHINKKAKLMAA